ncbi:MAG: sugar ABC transporter permease [Firmicutes bacterium]|jgi:multiple sugar transport system permease protein|nr:sugar ABC transporter permease [Bacillota bacterium]
MNGEHGLRTKASSSRRGFGFHDQRTAYRLIFPTLIVIAAVNFYPLFKGIKESFYSYSFIRPWEYAFIGFGNYIRAFQNHEFWSSLWISILWTIGGVILSYVLGLIPAVLLDKPFRGRGIYRTILMIPWIVPPVVSSMTWRWMFSDLDGYINVTLSSLGLISEPIYWLSDTRLALLACIIANVWRTYPFFMVNMLSALSGIPDEVYEAASVDGASKWQTFWYVTFPVILPVTVVSTLLQSIWIFNNFDIIYALTGGGPAERTTTLIIRAYREAFYYLEFGQGAAIAVISMVMMLILGMYYLRLQARTEM